jgi:hypothetical protein
MGIRSIAIAGRGGCVGGENFNPSTRPIKHGLQYLGSAHFKNHLKSVIHGSG